MHKILAIGGVALLAAPAVAQSPKAGKPEAVYWMTVDTASGLGAGGRGGLSPLAALSEGPQGRRSLALQLGIQTPTPPGPMAEHVPGAALLAKAPLVLMAPPVDGGVERSGESPRGVETPKGRVLVYWGCGERAGPNQPMVLDLAKLGAGNASSLSPGPLTAGAPPSPSSHRGYGEWPNERSSMRVSGNASLAGDHLVRSAHTPDIRFSLTPSQDFMPPLVLKGTSSEKGAAPLSWAPLSRSLGYFASAVGGSEGGDDVVFWTSSAVAILPTSVPDHLPAGDVTRLIERKVVLGPQVTSCTIPAEVVKAAPRAMLRMVAFGGEANFSFPPKPTNPKAPWIIEQVVKVRYASTSSAILGMPDLHEIGDGQESESDRTGGLGLRLPRAGSLLKGLGRIGP